MKKVFVFLLILVLISAFTISFSNANISEVIEIFRNTIKIEVNGEQVMADNFLLNGRTYIQLKEVAELLNKEVGWNPDTRVASINDITNQTDLSRLLPESKGFIWRYDGFAEYSHQMQLESINDLDQKREYVITGEVGDPSGGESNLDRSISIKYTIDGHRIIQEKVESAMLDSKFNKITLIQTPLSVGNSWQEQVVDKQGKVTTLKAFIQKIEIVEDGSKQYTVRYEDVNSSYYEERVIKENIGVINVEKLLELQDSSFPVSYFLFDFEVAKLIQTKLYFPDNNVDKLHLELRELLVSNDGTARAAVEGLIEGPLSNLAPSIPEGTQLLDISILNGVCTVDFSQAFVDNHISGSSNDLMTVYSIVNTLTEFSSIDKVKFLIEGKTGATFGNFVFNEALARREDLIE
jgi:hypothetical protein